MNDPRGPKGHHTLPKSSAKLSVSKIAAADKHVDLVPVATRAKQMVIDGISATRADGKASGFQLTLENWGKGNRVELFTVLAPAKVKITGPSVIHPIFGFGKVYALTGKPVIPILNQMGVMCEKIIDTIEAAARS